MDLFKKPQNLSFLDPPFFGNYEKTHIKIGPFWIFVKMHFPTKSTPIFSKSAFFDKKISLIFVRDFRKSDQSFFKKIFAKGNSIFHVFIKKQVIFWLGGGPFLTLFGPSGLT